MDEYMSGYDTDLKEDDPEFVPDLCWKLKKDGNKGYNIVIYSLDVHRKYTAYTVDAPYEIDGIEYPAGPVKKTNRHTIEGFDESFNKYFKEFERRDEAGNLFAYVKSCDAAEVNDNIVRHSICVTYHNNYLLPFPIPQQCLSLLETALYDSIEELTLQINRLKTREKRLRRQITETKETAAVNASRAQEKIRELYAQIDKKEECPVCYEDIAHDKLVVPACCHYICADCSAQWENGCPVCRGTQ
jgi:hypothetical protein